MSDIQQAWCISNVDNYRECLCINHFSSSKFDQSLNIISKSNEKKKIKTPGNQVDIIVYKLPQYRSHL